MREMHDAMLNTVVIDTCSPKRTLRVPTTLSFARKPETSDVATRQSPKPTGEKMGDITLATCPSMLCA